jgi:hypothetical protein
LGVFHGLFDAAVGLWAQFMFLKNENKNLIVDPNEAIKLCLYFVENVITCVVTLSLVYLGHLIGVKHTQLYV